VDQGYAFKVITKLKDIDKMKELAFTTPQEQRELLSDVLLQNETAAETEKIEGDLFSLRRPGSRKKHGLAARRTAGMLADFSGGQDMAYIEYNRSRNKDLKRGKGNAFIRKLKKDQAKRSAASK